MAIQAQTTATRILVVDDEPDLRTLYTMTLLREGYQVEAVGALDAAWRCLQEQNFEVVITDMRLPDGMGLELLQRLRSDQRTEKCVVITAYGSAENAVESLKAGAFDYLTKPVDLKQFRAVIASAALSAAPVDDSHFPAAAATTQAFGQGPDGKATPPNLAGRHALAQLVGTSAAMENVRDRIAKVARSMAPVFIRGESGTGKELAARALHANSHRCDGPLVAVNCSAIPESLLEAEFFGAKKGAFTGAVQDRKGYFQSASGGTLFLDEIGDLPLPMQAKLLRAIQERCVRPIGGAQEEPVNVRILSATHKNLSAEVQAGRFRQDLYYRVNVIEIYMPPLRERLEDLEPLCNALLARIANEAQTSVTPLSPSLLGQLAAQPLHGNVRELENLLHRAVALGEGHVIHLDTGHVPTLPLPLEHDEMPESGPNPLASAALSHAQNAASVLPADLQTYLDRQEREILVDALQQSGFNRTAAAAKLGLSLRQIRYRMARLGIDAPNQPTDPANGSSRHGEPR